MLQNFEHISLSVLNKMFVIRTETHKMHVQTVNWEDPDQTALFVLTFSVADPEGVKGVCLNPL